jgi:hypothetical protein
MSRLPGKSQGNLVQSPGVLRKQSVCNVRGLQGFSKSQRLPDV